MDHRGTEGSETTGAIIGAAIEVHRALGPGLLESAYESCMCSEMAARHIAFRRQVALPVEYKGVRLDCGYRVDFVIDSAIVIELKAVTAIEPIHEAQLLTYMKLGGWRLGLLLNSNVEVLRHRIRRRIL